MSNQRLEDNGDLRRYRIELPNMTDDDLDPFQFRLYAHYKRVCGGGVNGGECFESVTTTAKLCKMSRDKVIESRDWLTTNGWIDVTTDKKHILHIRIIDRWLENMTRYASRYSDRSRYIDFAPHELAVDISTQRSNYKKELTTCTDVHTHPEQQGQQQLTLSETEPMFNHQPEAEEGIDSNSASMNGKVQKGRPHPPTPRPDRKAKESKADPAATAAWEMYLAKIDEHEPGAVLAFSRERSGVNAIVKAGWTAEQIGQCFDIMKAQPFYQGKHLSAQELGKDIGAKLNGKTHKPNGAERIDRDLFFSNFKTGDLYE